MLILKHFSYYSSGVEINGKHLGGVGTLVGNVTPHPQLQLATSLQALAVQVSLPKAITLCSIYLPPHATWKEQDLKDLISQLPAPFLLLRDFNAHSPVWGCKKLDSKGKRLENILPELDICLLNNKSHTYIHPASGSQSAIDLSFCDSSVFLDFEWKVDTDAHDNDHIPVILKSSINQSSDQPNRWTLNRADWDQFQSLCSQ